MSNNREWFYKNKDQYVNYIETISQLFSEDLTLALEKITNQHMSFKIFRFYRDLRFSVDKTPYNTYIRLAFFPIDNSTKKLCDAPNAFYFSLESNQLMLGTGNMGFNPKQLQKYRKKLMSTSQLNRFANLCGHYQNLNYALNKPHLKKVPQGFQDTQEHIELSKYKGVTIFKSIDINDHNIENVFTITKNHFNEMLSFYQWFYDLNQL